jgi:hypothetical protein
MENLEKKLKLCNTLNLVNEMKANKLVIMSLKLLNGSYKQTFTHCANQKCIFYKRK